MSCHTKTESGNQVIHPSSLLQFYFRGNILRLSALLVFTASFIFVLPLSKLYSNQNWKWKWTVTTVTEDQKIRREDRQIDHKLVSTLRFFSLLLLLWSPVLLPSAWYGGHSPQPPLTLSYSHFHNPIRGRWKHPFIFLVSQGTCNGNCYSGTVLELINHMYESEKSMWQDTWHLQYI